MNKVIQFEEIHAKAAGIDIGSRGVFVSIDGEQVVSFKTFTSDYQLCCDYLKENGIVSVAMEATGVYWMCLYEMLEQHGIEVCLVHHNGNATSQGSQIRPKRQSLDSKDLFSGTAS
jgi:purine-nucleoside phosphorylase